jgi:hypothetical protein
MDFFSNIALGLHVALSWSNLFYLGIAAAIVAVAFGVVLWIESEAGHRFVKRRASESTGREVAIGAIDVKVDSVSVFT